jgi:hypothetical protein
VLNENGVESSIISNFAFAPLKLPFITKAGAAGLRREWLRFSTGSTIA